MHERLYFASQSSPSILRNEEDDDDNDCLVLSNKKAIEDGGKDDRKCRDPSNLPSPVDLLDDCTYDSILEDEGSIALALLHHHCHRMRRKRRLT